MKIIFSGGGTLGPVVPLLAVREAYLKHDPKAVFLWVGTSNGPERELVEASGIRFMAIGAGKWRRYFSLLNFFDLFKIIFGFFQSLKLLYQEKPNLVISCGGFVSVPLHFAANWLAIPQWVHQQDVNVGLANRLMFRGARKITTALQKTAENLPKNKTEWIGNPSRDLAVADLQAAYNRFGIPPGATVIFALGGGTGSASVNKLVLDAVLHWPKDWHIIHLVGKERPRALQENATAVFGNYHVYTFFTTEMKDALAIASVVIGRAGFSTLTEVAALKKPAIILPMFGTHQEDNARYFARQEGVIMLGKGTQTGLELAQVVKNLLQDPTEARRLGETMAKLLPRTKAEKIIQIINEVGA